MHPFVWVVTPVASRYKKVSLRIQYILSLSQHLTNVRRCTFGGSLQCRIAARQWSRPTHPSEDPWSRTSWLYECGALSHHTGHCLELPRNHIRLHAGGSSSKRPWTARLGVEEAVAEVAYHVLRYVSARVYCYVALEGAGRGKKTQKRI